MYIVKKCSPLGRTPLRSVRRDLHIPHPGAGGDCNPPYRKLVLGCKGPYWAIKVPGAGGDGGCNPPF